MEGRREFIIEIEPDEDGVFIATVPALPGVVEQGDTSEEALERVTEALIFTLNSMTEQGEEIPPSATSTREIRRVE
ncbi:MAG: type II toxin-antitoxin system HicB family antitoxin, partial [Actinomycetota bacterium]|nr:type II toxin-antitoxin system HicB family antitoxin [Actinomycetota bacterium]